MGLLYRNKTVNLGDLLSFYFLDFENFVIECLERSKTPNDTFTFPFIKCFVSLFLYKKYFKGFTNYIYHTSL